MRAKVRQASLRLCCLPTGGRFIAAEIYGKNGALLLGINLGCRALDVVYAHVEHPGRERLSWL